MVTDARHYAVVHIGDGDDLAELLAQERPREDLRGADSAPGWAHLSRLPR